MFTLNSKLESDTFFVDDLKLCRVLLMNDSNYPWLILVPRKPDLIELIDLSFDEQIEVLREVNLVSEILKKNFSADKLNIAALGNVVSQLHIHVIARFKNDASFPKPVFGAAPALPYKKEDAEKMIEKIKKFLAQK